MKGLKRTASRKSCVKERSYVSFVERLSASINSARCSSLNGFVKASQTVTFQPCRIKRSRCSNAIQAAEQSMTFVFAGREA